MYKVHPTVLLAEDDENDVLLLRKAFLQIHSVSLKVVSNGEQVVKYLLGEAPYNDRQKSPFPSVIVLDLKMPKKNGFEVLAWRQQQKEMTSLPAVILTASDQECDTKKAYALGASSYLVKPSGFDELVDMVGGFEKYWLTLNRIPAVIVTRS